MRYWINLSISYTPFIWLTFNIWGYAFGMIRSTLQIMRYHLNDNVLIIVTIIRSSHGLLPSQIICLQNTKNIWQ